VAGKKEQLAGIVSRSNILDDPETLDIYSRDQSFTLPVKPQLVVKPLNMEEVKGVVNWANRTHTPLVPVSSGPPRFQGDTVPSITGAVVLDLSGMKRIIRIDRKNRMVMIEPGVTYGQLQPELAKEGLRLSTPLLPRPNKSVITSLLERQPTIVPKYQWSLPEPLRCLEVVWGNGETIWTGEAGTLPHSLEKQWEKGLAQIDPKGPFDTDWYRIVSGAQGSMGIVTWASIKCEILPKVHRLFFIPAEHLEDLTDCAYRLLRLRLGDEFLLLNNSNLAYILGNGADKIGALREELPPWVIVIGIAGRDILPEERVEVQEKDIRDITKQFGLNLVSEVPGIRSGELLDVLLRTSREPYWKLGFKGGCQDIFFLTTLDKTPGFIKTMYSLAEKGKYLPRDMGIYLQPQHQGVACHCEFNLPFDPSDRTEVAWVKELYTRASKELIKQGAYFSRPYGTWADMVYDQDTQSTILLKGIKEILDPNHVLNPGKLCFQPVKE
jgi:FAD/FMN-containing dehydrogenase